METVLVVEDDRVYARTTTNWLVKNGINARYVLSVDSAKVFLEGHKVDLLLSDFRLNDSNGVELLEWMKAQGYRMPFLIMTGYGDIPGAVEAVKRGAADYLPKPIQTEKVLGIIRGLLNRRNRKKVKERAFYVGKSPLAVKLQNIVRVVAPADQLVRTDTWCIRNRKGVCGPAGTRIERTGRRAFHSGRLRSASEGTGGIGVVRPCEGCLYRSNGTQDRHVCRRQPRDTVFGRSG